MSRTYHHGKDRRLRVRGIRRPTDLRRLARVLIELEAAKARQIYTSIVRRTQDPGLLEYLGNDLLQVGPDKNERVAR